MTHVFEFIVALIIVFIIAVIVGVLLPSQAHIERSIKISHNPQQIYDVLNNFQRFTDYGAGELQAQDPGVKFSLSGPAYGKGATISWVGNQALGSGKLVNKSGHINLDSESTVVWHLTNDWHGTNKTFTLHVAPRADHRVSTVSWSYDVDYHSIIGRYSSLWVHGQPAQMIKMGLGALQNMLAGIPNVDYSSLAPGLYRAKATPVLLVSTSAERTLENIDAAKQKALKEIQAAMKKLDVEAAGPTTTVTIDYGDTTYTFDVAVPINTTQLEIDKATHDLTQLPPPPVRTVKATSAAGASSTASASSAASAASAASASSAGQPASASSAGAAAKKLVPGTLDKENRLVVSDQVRALMMPEREVLEATWTGEAGIPLVRLALQAYAGTHGYAFNLSTNPIYDQLNSAPHVTDPAQTYRVFLPVKHAPVQTPAQAAGRTAPLMPVDPAIWGAKPKSAKSSKQKHKLVKKSAHQVARRRAG